MSPEEDLCTRILIKVLQSINIEGIIIEDLPKLSLILVILKKTWEQSGPLGVLFMS